MKLTIHPAVFLLGALLSSAAWLWARPASQVAPMFTAAETRAARAAVQVDARTLERYAGTYRLDANTVVELVLESGRLFAILNGSSRFEMLAKSTTEFFFTDIEAEIKFDAEQTDNAERFVVRFPGGSMTAERVR